MRRRGRKHRRHTSQPTPKNGRPCRDEKNEPISHEFYLSHCLAKKHQQHTVPDEECLQQYELKVFFLLEYEAIIITNRESASYVVVCDQKTIFVSLETIDHCMRHEEQYVFSKSLEIIKNENQMVKWRNGRKKTHFSTYISACAPRAP